MKEDEDGKCWYLSAFGTGDRQPNATLAGMSRVTYQPVVKKQEMVDGKMMAMEEVDDYLTWTIVGIGTSSSNITHSCDVLTLPVAQTQYSFFDAFGELANPPKLPITNFPTLANQPLYRPAMPALQHSLLLSVNDFYYDIHRPNGFSGRQTLDVWVGNLGPLPVTVSQQSAPGNGSSPPSDSSAILIVDLPPMQDILQALYDATLRRARPHPRLDGDPGLSTAIDSESPPNGPTGLNGSSAHYDSAVHLANGENSSHASGAGPNGRTPAAGPSKNKLRAIVPAGTFFLLGNFLGSPAPRDPLTCCSCWPSNRTSHQGRGPHAEASHAASALHSRSGRNGLPLRACPDVRKDAQSSRLEDDAQPRGTTAGVGRPQGVLEARGLGHRLAGPYLSTMRTLTTPHATTFTFDMTRFPQRSNIPDNGVAFPDVLAPQMLSLCPFLPFWSTRVSQPISPFKPCIVPSFRLFGVPWSSIYFSSVHPSSSASPVLSCSPNSHRNFVSPTPSTLLSFPSFVMHVCTVKQIPHFFFLFAPLILFHHLTWSRTLVCTCANATKDRIDSELFYRTVQ